MNGEHGDLEDMPDQISLSRGVRGRFAGRMNREVIVMEIIADVARVFPSGEEVNAALRVLMKAAASVDLQTIRRAS